MRPAPARPVGRPSSSSGRRRRHKAPVSSAAAASTQSGDGDCCEFGDVQLTTAKDRGNPVSANDRIGKPVPAHVLATASARDAARIRVGELAALLRSDGSWRFAQLIECEESTSMTFCVDQSNNSKVIPASRYDSGILTLPRRHGRNRNAGQSNNSKVISASRYSSDVLRLPRPHARNSNVLASVHRLHQVINGLQKQLKQSEERNMHVENLKKTITTPDESKLSVCTESSRASFQRRRRLFSKQKTHDRRQWLQTLEQRIGPQKMSSWKAEYAAALAAGAESLCLDIESTAWQVWASPEAVHKDKKTNGNLQKLMASGLTEEEALCLACLMTPPIAEAVGSALRRKSNEFSALTHTGYGILAKHSSKQEKQQGVSCHGYLHVHGGAEASVPGLADTDSRWSTITEPDETGFRGLTSYHPIRFYTAHKSRFDPKGLLVYVQGKGKIPMHSDVVCLESDVRSGRELHSAVRLGEHYVDLPPLCLYAVVGVKTEGFDYEYWEEDSSERMTMIKVHKKIFQRLIIVRPTFMLPASLRPDHGGMMGKFTSHESCLTFGSLRDGVEGLDYLIDQPVFSMAEEWQRDRVWTDWRGKEYTSKEQWEYVNTTVQSEPSTVQSGTAIGERDTGHEGFTVGHFMNAVNTYIRTCLEAQRQHMKKSHKSAWSRLSKTVSELTKDEVLAIRLYTGPAYQPINTFLRHLLTLRNAPPEWVDQIITSKDLTFACTCKHLINGLRKLARVTKPASVFRAVRGSLPDSFWTPDEFGRITVTDGAFQSTSMKESVCMEYLGNSEKGVLWEIRCKLETDSGHHCGADVRILSQYPAEEEILFPPLTMLTVEFDEKVDEPKQIVEKTAKGEFVRVVVEPLWT